MSDADALISAWLDGQLDERGLAEFDAWLAASREHQRRFLRMVMAHRGLVDRGAVSAARRGAAPTVRRRARPALRLPRSRLTALAAGLALTVLGGFAWWSQSHRTGTGEPAMIVAASGATVRDAEGELTAAAGTGVRAGDRVTVADGGSIELRFADGTTVRGEGGSAFTVAAGARGKRFDLARGRLAAEVTPQPAARPLVIATADAEVTVVGTALAVVAGEGETRAEVTRGRVRLTRAGDRAEVAIDAGQYAIAAPATPLAAHAIGAPSGTVYRVGAGEAYAGLEALPDIAAGDVVELHAGTYRGGRSWRAGGTALRPITIRAAGDGTATIDGDGVGLSGVGDIPRALFQIAGDHWRIEGLDFAHAGGDAQAAAIRCRGSRDVVVRGCRITRCVHAIDTEDAEIRIEDCEIAWCGDHADEGAAHALRLTGPSAVIDRCDIHDIVAGQALKGGTRALTITRSRITAAEDGEIDIIGDGGGGADAVVVMTGNLVRSEPRKPRANVRRFIEAMEGSRRGTLYLTSNTFIAGDGRIVFVATGRSGVRVVAEGNIFVGSDQIADGLPGAITGRANWFAPGAKPPAGLGGIASGGANPGFVDPANGDYRLRAGSPCLGAAPADLVWHDATGGSRPAPAVTAPGRGAAGPVGGGGRVVGAFAAAR